MQLDADRYPLLYSLRGALSPARKNAKAARQAAAKRRAWTAEYSQLVFSLIDARREAEALREAGAPKAACDAAAEARWAIEKRVHARFPGLLSRDSGGHGTFVSRDDDTAREPGSPTSPLDRTAPPDDDCRLRPGGRRARRAPTRARADDGPGHDRDGPGRRRSRRPLRRAAARTAPAFSGGVTDFTALDVLEWTTRRRRIAPVHSPLAISLVSTIAQILLVQTPQVGYKFADGGPAAARVGSSVGAGRYRYHWPSLIRCPIRKTTRL